MSYLSFWWFFRSFLLGFRHFRGFSAIGTTAFIMWCTFNVNWITPIEYTDYWRYCAISIKILNWIELFISSVFIFKFFTTLKSLANFKKMYLYQIQKDVHHVINHSMWQKVLAHAKKSLYNQPKPYFFKKLLWSHF
jgi:hypothetical protein